MSEPLSIASLPHGAAFNYEDGVLDVVGGNELMRLHGWQGPKAFRKIPRQEWSPFAPAFRIVRPTPAAGQHRSLQTAQSSAAEQSMQAAFDAFSSDLPSDVAAALGSFPGHQWNLLLLIHREPDALDLVNSSPALAWCLANCDTFRSVYGQSTVDWARWRVRHKQTRILEWLGFPADRSTVKLLRKLAPSCVDPTSMRMLRSTLLTNPRAEEMLRHQSRVNNGSIGCAVSGECPMWQRLHW